MVMVRLSLHIQVERGEGRPGGGNTPPQNDPTPIKILLIKEITNMWSLGHDKNYSKSYERSKVGPRIGR